MSFLVNLHLLKSHFHNCLYFCLLFTFRIWLYSFQRLFLQFIESDYLTTKWKGLFLTFKNHWLSFLDIWIRIYVKSMLKISLTFHIKEISCWFTQSYMFLFLFTHLILTWSYGVEFFFTKSFWYCKRFASIIRKLMFLLRFNLVIIRSWSWIKFSPSFGN